MRNNEETQDVKKGANEKRSTEVDEICHSTSLTDPEKISDGMAEP